MKDGIPIENTGISYSLNDPWNRTLSLVSANLTHTGKYTCQARLRSGGFPTVSADAQVTVLGEYLSSYVITPTHEEERLSHSNR